MRGLALLVVALLVVKEVTANQKLTFLDKVRDTLKPTKPTQQTTQHVVTKPLQYFGKPPAKKRRHAPHISKLRQQDNRQQLSVSLEGSVDHQIRFEQGEKRLPKPLPNVDKKPQAVDRLSFLSFAAAMFSYSPVLYKGQVIPAPLPFCAAKMDLLTGVADPVTDVQFAALNGTLNKDAVTGKEPYTIILTFRGTDSRKDALEVDVDIARRVPKFKMDPDWEYSLKDIQNTKKNGKPCTECGKLHRGFLKQYTAVRHFVLGMVNEFIIAHPRKVDQLILTGHSLGAGLSTVAMVDLAASGLLDKVRARGCKVYHVTFGSPRVGNSATKKFYQKHVDLNNVRRFVLNKYGHKITGLKKAKVLVDQDPFTSMPPKVLGYRHVSDATYIKCPKELQIGRSFFKAPLLYHRLLVVAYVMKIQGWFTPGLCRGRKEPFLFHEHCFIGGQSGLWVSADLGMCRKDKSVPVKLSAIDKLRGKKPQCTLTAHCKDGPLDPCSSRKGHMCVCGRWNNKCLCVQHINTARKASRIICERTKSTLTKGTFK